MPRPEILQVGPYPVWDQVPLDQAYTMHGFFKTASPASFLTEHGHAIRGIATRGELGACRKMIEACPNLEIVAVYGVGYDAVDLDACRERNVRVTNTPDVLTRDVADLGVATMLCQARGMIGAEAWVRSGDWARKGLYPLERRVHESKSGVLGLGRIGREVARRLVGFDMEVAYSDLAPKDCTPDWTFNADPVELARHSDYLFVTLAASEETRKAIGKLVRDNLTAHFSGRPLLTPVL